MKNINSSSAGPYPYRASTQQAPSCKHKQNCEAEQNWLRQRLKQTATDQAVKHNQEETDCYGKIIHAVVLNAVSRQDNARGTNYKELVELIPLAEIGKHYLAHDLITIEDPASLRIWEGKRILISWTRNYLQWRTVSDLPVSSSGNGRNRSSIEVRTLKDRGAIWQNLKRLIVQIFSLIPVVWLLFFDGDRVTKQENRLTVLEKDIENSK